VLRVLYGIHTQSDFSPGLPGLRLRDTRITFGSVGEVEEIEPHPKAILEHAFASVRSNLGILIPMPVARISLVCRASPEGRNSLGPSAARPRRFCGRDPRCQGLHRRASIWYTPRFPKGNILKHIDFAVPLIVFEFAKWQSAAFVLNLYPCPRAWEVKVLNNRIAYRL
jgi:hypothetical protein